VSADPINFALPLLVVGWTFRARERETAVAPLLAVALLVSLLKPTALMVLGLLWLIPAQRFGGRKLLVLSAHAALALALYWLWNHDYATLDIARWFFPSRPPIAEVRAFFLHRPLQLGQALLSFLARDLWLDLPDVYGAVGPWLPPGIARILFVSAIPALLATALSEARRTPSDRTWGAALLAVSVGGMLAIGVVLLFTFGDPASKVAMVSGRYFPVACLTLALGVLELLPEGHERLLSAAGRLALLLNCANAAMLLVSTAGRLR
jgi:hypothetical protein